MLVSVVVVACSSNPPVEEERPPSQTVLDCLLAQRLCDALEQCGDATRHAQYRSAFHFSTSSECIPALTAALDSDCYKIESSIAAGLVTEVDEEARLTCEKFTGLNGCEAFLDRPFRPIPWCRDRPFVSPRVWPGGSCTWDGECTDHFICGEGGACVRAPRRDEPCHNRSCEDGLFCEADGVCRGVTDCESDGQCGESEYCDQPGTDFEVGESVGGQCTPRLQEGSICDSVEACQNDCEPPSNVDRTYRPHCMRCMTTNGLSDTGHSKPGLCEQARDPGDSCTHDIQCRSSRCNCVYSGFGTCMDAGVCI